MSGSDVGGTLLLGFLGFLYFLPFFVACVRKCKAFAGIAVVNLFLGWTLVGWVVALAWAACGEVRAPEASQAAELSLSDYDPRLWKVTRTGK